MLNDNQCPICNGLGEVSTGIGMFKCDACAGVGLKTCKSDFELVGYLTGEVCDSYPVFLSIEKLNDYEIDVSEMTPLYILN